MLAAAVALRHGEVVLERGVRLVERIRELEALEDVVVLARRRAVAAFRIDHATDCPDRTGLALDPDEDALFAAAVVDPSEHPLREPAAVGRRDLHCPDYT